MVQLKEVLGKTGSVSRLEQSLGFEDVAFRSYLQMSHFTRPSTSLLLELSEVMAEHNHPVVRYAAGWAAAEVGVKRRKSRLELAHRLDALDTAATLWAGLPSSFEKVIKDADSTDIASNLRGLDLRAKQATAYLPSLMLAATWFSGKEVSHTDVKNVQKLTNERLLDLALHVETLTGEGDKFDQIRGEISNVILIGSLINLDPLTRFLVIPAPLKQDNNFSMGSRAELFAIATEAPYRRTRIHISLNELHTNDEKGRFVIQGKDLLPDKNDPYMLLRKYIGKNTGIPQSPTDLVWLDMLPGDLASKIAAYDTRREERQMLLSKS